jgi:hypothetical protein
MFVFATHTVLTETDSPHGYLLLHCIRAYLDMIMFENLEVHTSATIFAGQKAVICFGELFTVSFIFFTTQISILFNQEYIAKLSSEDAEFKKNLDFPKYHAQNHVFDCIKAKGVLRNYTTRLFERLHIPLKKAYANHTNFKNVAPQVCKSYAISINFPIILCQILKLERRKVACSIIRSNIYAMRADEASISSEGDDADDDEDTAMSTFGGIYLGAYQKPCSFNDIARVYHRNSAFTQFHAHFRK